MFAPLGRQKQKCAVEDTVQGPKLYRYRYLENGDARTPTVVEQEWPTRAASSIRCPDDRINARLSQLLTIGTVGARRSAQVLLSITVAKVSEPAVLYVREGRRH